MKKDEKPDTLAIINNYKFYDRQKDGHCHSMAQRPEGRVCKKSETKKSLGFHGRP